MAMIMQWRIFILSALAVFMIVLTLIWQGIAMAEDVAQEKEELKNLQQLRSEVLQLQAEHPDLALYRLETATEKKRMEAMLPDTMALEPFISELQKIATLSSMQLLEISPGEPEEGEGAVRLPVSLKLSGDYFSLLDLLDRLQRGGRLVQVDAMELEQGERLECRLELGVFAEKLS